ncbi:MAG TPA: carbon-nitrogen hydrolase family protein [Clostridiales bacterium]|nr:carbon-nitrogen hydrolase family protein [Clostridiales bacterium]
MSENIVPGNRIIPFDSDSWTNWTPRAEIAPLFRRENTGNTALLEIESHSFNNFGKWVCTLNDIPGGKEFNFQVEYLPKDVEYERLSIFAMLTWRDSKGRLAGRDYADQVDTLADGWKSLHRTVVSPDSTWSVTIELGFRWTDKGSVTWRNPVFCETGKRLEKRMVRVATTSLKTRHDPAMNLEVMKEYIDKAGQAGADIVCFTEAFYGMFAGIAPEEISQPVPGDLTRALGEKAKENGIYVIFSMYERIGANIYNTEVLLDRNGDVAGKYHKVHLPFVEGEEGVTPGREYKVFQTDFGVIGPLICWDQEFPEAARCVAELGAEIIFISTIGNEPLMQAARAKDNGVYVVVAGMYGPESSKVIDPFGEVIATVRTQNPGLDEGICVVDIDLNKRHFTDWLSLGPCPCEPRHIYINERRKDTYGGL